ncbi:MAG TPA: DUF4126 domain-containing protein [Thermomicrobiales bacterium]|nr:DUF4126 domain-containing protein [Thermomicrobiales bacterium]
MLPTLLAGLGLSTSAGLNAYLPLLILALADRISSSFNLPGPYDAVSSNAGIIVILLVMAVEIIGDKLPRIDHINDLIHMPIRAAVGGFCFMGVAAEAGDMNVWLAGAIGFIVAGGVSYWKTRMRPAITTTTNGIGNPIISMQEDAVAIILSIVALAWPWGIALMLPLLGWWIVRAETRMSTGNSSLMRLLQPQRKD